MDIINGIALASMEMASAKVANEVHITVMKNAMDIQEESLAILLKSMGIGRNINIKA